MGPDGTGGPDRASSATPYLAENERLGDAGPARHGHRPEGLRPGNVRPERRPAARRSTGLTLLAIVGIVDPPRPAAKAAIAEAHAAGIQVRMITGDHAVTAEAIAHQLGIEGRAITGADFRALSDDEAMRQIDGIGVIARVSPEDKVHLVDILRKKGHVVGDDRRRRQRRTGPQEGRHRHRDGDHRHGGLQAGRRDDPDRRQLRHDRQGGRARARRVRQPDAVHPLPDGRPVRVHRHVPRLVAAEHPRRHPVPAAPDDVAQLHRQRVPGDRARLRQAARGPHGGPAAAQGAEDHAAAG